MQQQKSNITWQSGKVQKHDREQLLGQKGMIVWFTGLPGSGKSTLAIALERRLFEYGMLCYRLDGDNIRHGLNSDLRFSPEDRQENIRRIGEVAKLFADAGIIVITAFISPYRRDREMVRALAPQDFIEVSIRCPVEVCESRDPKGLYQKARTGEIGDFTGIHAPYEEPEHPELIIDTASNSVEQSVEQLLAYLKEHQRIK